MIFFDDKNLTEKNTGKKYQTMKSPMYDDKMSRRIYERSVLFKETKPFNFSGTPTTVVGRKKFSNIMLDHDYNIRNETNMMRYTGKKMSDLQIIEDSESGENTSQE